MIDFFNQRFSQKEKLKRRKNAKYYPEEIGTPEIQKKENPMKKYRNGGEGFITWCEDFINLAIYKENATVPSWIPMNQMPTEPNPDTGRSYKDMWEMQKPIYLKALAMENGRFLHRLVILCWMRGEGKCEKKGNKVVMLDGTLKKVEDIRVGDLLMGDDNTPRKVLSLVNGREEMFEVTPMRGEPFVVTGDHELTLTHRANCKTKNGKPFVDKDEGKVFDITVNDFLKQNKSFKNRNLLFRVPINWPKQEVPLDPYFLGIWLGDGSSNKPDVTTMDQEVVDYLYQYAEKKNLDVTVQIKTSKGVISKAKTYSLVKRAGQNENHLFKKMRDMGLINNKHIPHIYKANSREIRLKLLAGLLDSDGCRNRNSMQITLKRKELCEDICFIARSLGFHAEMKECQKGIKSTGFVGTYYRVGISGDCSIIPLRVEHKKCEKRSNWKEILVTGIKSIKSVGDEDYYGFMLDGNHRYVREDFTVTHNSLSACLIQLWKFFCFPRQQIMLGANSKDQVKFVHYDIMREIILNSPKLLAIIGRKNIQEKEMRLMDSKKRVVSMVRSISSFSGIVSNITGYTFSEIFDMKNPKFFVQLDGSIRNMPNALGVIDSTVSEKTHILYQLYASSIESKEKGEQNLTYVSYRCSPEGRMEDFFNPQMTQKQLDDYRRKFPPAEFARYFKNLWDTGISKLFSPESLEAMHYIGLKGKYVFGDGSLSKLLKEKNEKKKYLEIPDDERRFEVSEETIHAFIKATYEDLIPITDVYRLDYSEVFCDCATVHDLERFSEIYDTNWVIGIGIDRADPMKARSDGARTMFVAVAKGLPGSRSDSKTLYDTDSVSKYIYVILTVKHLQASSIEEMKTEINLVEMEFGGVDMVCSERWGMFDICPWLDDKGIEYEILQPTIGKQKESFSELFILVQNERIKISPIGYFGSKEKDIFMEEMKNFETTPGKDWYGSPEKNKTGGIQDDTVFATGWSIYGLRFKGVSDMQPRIGKVYFGDFVKNKELLGEY